MHLDLPEKRYYKIGEVAKAFSLNTSHIRFWENEFEILKPKKKYTNKDKVSAYFTTDLKNFNYQGGEWKNNTFELSTRTLGKYTLLKDTIPPRIKVVQQNRDYFRCYITDDLSGIQNYELFVDGKWVLMNYDPKRNYIWAQKLDNSKPFSGKLELKVRDNVNNEKIYSTTIK